MASRRTVSRTASASARSDFRNLSRAGVAKNRSRTSTRVPSVPEAGVTSPFAPASTTIRRACGASASRETISSRATEAIEGQGFPPEAERGDRLEVAVRQFGGGVPLDGEREVVRAHAPAVVDDADQPSPAGLDGDLDAARAGVERVLDQFLDGGGRALHHLAGGDAVDEHGIEATHARLRHGGPDTTRGTTILPCPSPPSHVACARPPPWPRSPATRDGAGRAA